MLLKMFTTQRYTQKSSYHNLRKPQTFFVLGSIENIFKENHDLWTRPENNSSFVTV